LSLRLMVERGGDVEEHGLEGTVYIGRARDNHVILDAADVSRHHARIDVNGATTSIVDLGSANGTEVNGSQIDPRQPVSLKEGDRITIAGFVLRVGSAKVGYETQVMPLQLSSATQVAAESRLIIKTSAGERAFPLGGQKVSIGRSSSNDIVIPEAAVSKAHAILHREGTAYFIEDAGSANGTFLNGERITRRALADGDVMTIGQSVSLTFTAPTSILAGEARPIQAPAGLITPSSHPLVVGRDSSCDIILDHPSISRRHARIGPPWPDGSREITDLGSTNGTFIDGQRIASGETARAPAGSLLRVGPVALQLDETGSLAEGAEELGITAIRLRQEVGKGVNLLQDISLEIRPREFVAVVGVSGAGKSTLVGALSGLKPASHGAVLVNGADLYRDFDAFRTVLGFVPQDDILHRELPLSRALEYTAALRLPEDTSPEERRQRVAEVIATLGLEGRKDLPVSRLSGGQRKRVSIGAELLTRPGLFFLDEATSGLDPGTEGQLMRLLRHLADEGHTVVLITHATKNVMLCDKVAFLARGGHLVFYGPPEQALDHFGVRDFDGIYDRLEAEAQPQQWADQFRASAAYRAYVQPAAEAVATPKNEGAPPQRPRVSWLRQFGVLSRRYLDIISRDRLNLAILALIAPIVGLIYLVAWPRDAMSFETGDASRAFTMAFLVSLLPMILASVSSTREIVKEAAVYLRERTVSLRIGPYVASKVTVAAVLAVWHSIWLTLFWALSIDLPGGGGEEWVNVFISTFLVVLSGSTLGLLISALAPREEQAVLLIIAVIIVQIVFSGGVLPLSDMGIAGTVLGALTAANWGYQAMVASMNFDASGCETPPFTECRLPGFAEYQTEEGFRSAVRPLDDRYGDIWDPNLFVSWLAMAAIIAATVAAIYFIQRRKDVR
jgi:ABC-type multidrug transport system ATPase subunit